MAGGDGQTVRNSGFRNDLEEGEAMISLSAAVMVVVYLIVAGLIFGLLWWLIGYCGLPAPFDKVARVVLAVLAVLVIIGILLSLVSGRAIFSP